MPKLGICYPEYRKHRRSGQAIVTINGHDFLLGPHGTQVSRNAYDQRIAEWISSGRSCDYGRPPPVRQSTTCVELIDLYILHARAYDGKGPNSELRRIVRVMRPVCKLYRRTAACKFGAIKFTAVRHVLINEGLSRSFVNATTRRILALREGFDSRHPARRRPPIGRRRTSS